MTKHQRQNTNFTTAVFSLGLIIGILILLASPPSARAARGETLKTDTFLRLTKIKNRKKEQIQNLLSQAEARARSAEQDETLIKFFHTMARDKELLKSRNDIPDSLQKAIGRYQKSINEYYLNCYQEFYDLLFIDADGFVMYTVRKESDYHSNVFNGHLRHTGLVKCLKSPEYEFFIDFQYYAPADEPAAFFLVRVYQGGKHLGWIVFQYALNRLNALLVDHDELGQTGEVYIVNQDYFMLTQSRFRGDCSCLKLRVDTEAVRFAMHRGAGQGLITGYHGTRVFVSYDRFDFWETTWIIIASIEEDEVLTDYYHRHAETLLPELIKALPEAGIQGPDRSLPGNKTIKVDMDEFIKAAPGETLLTRGVSTCTAVTGGISNRFGYLAHISTHDKIYDSSNPLHSLKDMVQRIRHYDIYLHEMDQLRFTVIANHTRSIRTIIDKLLKYGIMISQIRFTYNPDARYANVAYDPGQGLPVIEWVYDTGFEKRTFTAPEAVPNLALILKKVLDYNDRAGSSSENSPVSRIVPPDPGISVNNTANIAG